MYSPRFLFALIIEFLKAESSICIPLIFGLSVISIALLKYEYRAFTVVKILCISEICLFIKLKIASSVEPLIFSNSTPRFPIPL